MRNTISLTKFASFFAIALFLTSSIPTAAQDSGRNLRFEISVGLFSWPDVEDFESITSKSPDKIGFNIVCGVHLPIRKNGRSDFLLGLDMGIFPNSEGIFAGGGFLLPALKWRPGDKRNLSLDAGFGYYKADFAEIVDEAPFLGGTDIWHRDGFGGFFGGTWDMTGSQRSESNGLLLSFKIHFVDLGKVEGLVLKPPLMLDEAARKLNRGFYQLQLGYQME